MNNDSVAKFLSMQFEKNRLSISNVGLALNISPEFLEMLTRKSDPVRVPVHMVEPLSEALGLNAADLLERVLREYMPDTWDVIERLLINQEGVTANGSNGFDQGRSFS